MKRREQASLLLRKAAQDEALLDEVLGSKMVSDEVIGFHCQQAAEKMLKALLSDLGIDNGWVQDLAAAEHYVPDFEREGHPFEPGIDQSE